MVAGAWLQATCACIKTASAILYQAGSDDMAVLASVCATMSLDEREGRLVHLVAVTQLNRGIGWTKYACTH